MNFNGIEDDERIINALGTLEKNGRIPHAVIIEGENDELTSRAARVLSMYMVCSGADKPCGKCPNCVKVIAGGHADISFPKPENKKSNTYSIIQIRDIIRDAYIIPNEAEAKVFVFENSDNRFSNVVQNSLLKLIEEPPANVYFIFTCSSSLNFLVTVLSRCTVVKIPSGSDADPEAVQKAVKIAQGILSPREYDLMLALRALTDREEADNILTSLKALLRDAVAIQEGAKSLSGSDASKAMASRFTKHKLINMLELCESSSLKIKQNININLLITWLCGELRRISWQR